MHHTVGLWGKISAIWPGERTIKSKMFTDSKDHVNVGSRLEIVRSPLVDSQINILSQISVQKNCLLFTIFFHSWLIWLPFVNVSNRQLLIQNNFQNWTTFFAHFCPLKHYNRMCRLKSPLKVLRKASASPRFTKLAQNDNLLVSTNGQRK